MRTKEIVNYFFTKDHEWLLPGKQFGTVGITDYAQNSLQDVVYVELPKIGDRFGAHESFGSVESVKAISELFVPISCEIVEINKRIADEPELVNSDPYGAGWMIKIHPTNKEELESLLNLIDYKIYTNEVEHILYLDEVNKIHYLTAVRGEEGNVIVNSKSFESLLTLPLINYSERQQKETVEEFEYLINKKNLKEYELQKFFEEHQEFLLGVDYESLHSQVVLKSEDDTLRPDFILKPIAGVSYQPNIVELKLPGQKIIRPKANRERPYDVIIDAIAQLRTYAAYFDEQKNREYVREVLGFTAYKPRLTLIVGKTISHADEKVTAAVLDYIRNDSVELVTYNDLLQKYKKLIKK